MADIHIKGDIIINDYKEFYDWFGWDSICPNDVNEVLKNTAPDERIDVYINSGGGHVMAGQEIYSALRADQRVYIHVQGMACSAASIIAMAGKSDISPVGMLMIHNVSGAASGDYHEMEKARIELKTMNEALVHAYADKTGMDTEQLLKMMDKETWLTANQCVEYGFINNIDKPANANAVTYNSYNSGIRLTDELIEKARKEIREHETLKNQLLEDLDMYGV